MRANTYACDRARQWLSLRLDGELSELEQALLAAHLERCDACRTFEAETAALTAALRAAPLERLQPIALPRRRRVSARAFQAGAAAAAVVAAGVLGSTIALPALRSGPAQRSERAALPRTSLIALHFQANREPLQVVTKTRSSPPRRLRSGKPFSEV